MSETYEDLIILGYDDRIIPHSAYLFAKISEQLADLIMPVTERLRIDMAEAGRPNIRFVASLPEFPTKFIKYLLDNYVIVRNTIYLPYIAKQISKVDIVPADDSEFHEDFLKFASKYLLGKSIDYFRIFMAMIGAEDIGGGKYSYDIVAKIIDYCPDLSELIGLIKQVYDNYDKKIYEKIPEKMKIAIKNSFNAKTYEKHMNKIVNGSLSFFDINPLLVEEIARIIKDKDSDIANRDELLMKYIEFLEQKCKINNDNIDNVDNTNDDGEDLDYCLVCRSYYCHDYDCSREPDEES